MDEIFHKTTNPFNVVRFAKPSETPRRYGKKGELLLNYLETEEGGRSRGTPSQAASSHGEAEKSDVEAGKMA